MNKIITTLVFGLMLLAPIAGHAYDLTTEERNLLRNANYQTKQFVTMAEYNDWMAQDWPVEYYEYTNTLLPLCTGEYSKEIPLRNGFGMAILSYDNCNAYLAWSKRWDRVYVESVLKH